ncbi:MAG: hypothetical protein AB1Z29_26665 [Desulfobacterales bacterium]
MQCLVILKNPVPELGSRTISDHRQGWKYEEGLWKDPGPRSANDR